MNTKRVGTLAMTVLAVAAWQCFGGALRAGAEPRFPGGYLNDLKPGRVTTPHIEWGRPYAPGTSKVFFLTPGYVAPREIIELWQRFDIDYEAVIGMTSYNYYDLNRTGTDQWTRSIIGCNPGEKMDELKAKLKDDYDAYFFSQFDWESAPAWVRSLILHKVSEEGKGLVLTWQSRNGGMGKDKGELGYAMTRDPDGQAYMTQGIPFSNLRYFSEPLGDSYYDKAVRPEFDEQEGGPANVDERIAKTIRCYTYGKGRVVWIGWHGSTLGYSGQPGITPTFSSYRDDDEIDYEYYMSLAARAVSWAAPGKAMPLRLAANPLPAGAKYTLAAAASLPVRFVAAPPAGTVPAGPVSLQWTLRDRHGIAEQAGVLDWNGWAKGEALALKPLSPGAGRHFLDWIVRNPAGVINWGSTGFVVDGGESITSIKLAKATFEPGEAITGQAKLEAPCPANCQLRVRLVDSYGRLYAQNLSALAAGATTANFSIAPRDNLALEARVQVALVNAGTSLADAETLAYLPKRTWPRYIFSMWGGEWPGVSGRNLRDQLRLTGFNVLGLDDPRMAASSDLPTMPTNIVPIPGEMIDDNAFSYVEAQWRAKSINKLTAKIKESAPFSYIGYSFGDEDSIGGKTDDAASLALFSTRLQKEYGELKNLNSVWNSHYTSWEKAAVPIAPGDATRNHEYAHYQDWASHVELLYADLHTDYAKAIHEIQPAALTGAEGSQGGDLELTTANIEFWGPYYNRFENALLSSIRRERTRPLVWGNWWGSYTYFWGTGYFRTKVTVPYLLWNFTLDGANTVEFFTADGTEGMSHMDGGFAEHFGWAADDVWKLSNGVGQLIADAKPGSRGLYLVHSQKSDHASDIWSPLGAYAAAQSNLLMQLDESGIDAPYLTERQIEAGLLAKKTDAKVLFLSDVQAMDDSGLSAIEGFVNSGGTVIADVRPMLCDGHLRPRADDRVAKLFGIAQGGDPAAAGAVADVEIVAGADGPALSLKNATVDPTVAVTSGVPMGMAGKAPVGIVNHVGKGKTILLNFTLANFRTLRAMQKGDETGLKEFIIGLLGKSGVKPVARVERPDGQLLELCRAASFTRGDLTILGLLRRPEALQGSGAAVVKLPAPVHVYDMLAGKDLGIQSSLKLTLEAGQRALYSLTPYNIDAVDLVAPAAANAGTTVAVAAALRTSAGQPGQHIIRLQVYGPDGLEREALRQCREAPAGKAAFKLPFSLNAAPGAWKITATDVPSGTTATKALTLAGDAALAPVMHAIALSQQPPKLTAAAAAFPRPHDWTKDGASLFRFRSIIPGSELRKFDWIRLYGLGLQYWGFLEVAPNSEPDYKETTRSWDDMKLRSLHRPLEPGLGQFDSFADTSYCRNLSIPGGDFSAVRSQKDSMSGRAFQWHFTVPGIDGTTTRKGFEPDEVLWGGAYLGATLLRHAPDGLGEFRWKYRRWPVVAAPSPDDDPALQVLLPEEQAGDDPAAPHGIVSARFVKGPSDEFAFARFQAVPDAGSVAPRAITRLSLNLSAVSPAAIPGRERWLRSAIRDMKVGDKISLDPQKEWALAFYNHGAQESGGDLLVYQPDDVAGVTATLNGEILQLEFTPKQQYGAIRLGFWEFSDTPFASALTQFFGQTAQLKARLGSIDWRADRNEEIDVDAYQQHVKSLVADLGPEEEACRQRLPAVMTALSAAAKAALAPAPKDAPNIAGEIALETAGQKAQTLQDDATEVWLQRQKK